MSKSKKTPDAAESAAPMTTARIAEAMKSAGYESVRFVPKNILVEIQGGSRDANGNKAVEPMSVHDVILAPGLLTQDGNWSAIQIAKDLAIRFREFQLCGSELILRDVRDLQA